MKQGEPKPHSFCKTPEEKCTINYCDINGCQNRKRELVELQEQFKQETIEEVAERVTEEWFKNNCYAKELFIKGAKWQQERMYSEEDLKYAFDSGRVRLTFDKERPFVFKNYEEFIEQFKNK